VKRGVETAKDAELSIIGDGDAFCERRRWKRRTASEAKAGGGFSGELGNKEKKGGVEIGSRIRKVRVGPKLFTADRLKKRKKM